MTIEISVKRRGVSRDNSRAIVKVKDFDGASALFNVKWLEDMVTVLKKMDMESVEIGVDKESDSLLFFMDIDRTIAYAMAASDEEEE